MATFRKRGQHWYYRYTNHDGRRVEKKGCPDRRATEEIARAAETKAAKIRSGEIDPRDIAFAAHERSLLTAHLDDFRRALEDKGSSAKHASVTANRVRQVITLARAKRISDLTLSKAQNALAKLRKPPEDGKGKGLSVETINHHVRAVKSFSRWLWKDKRAREHVLAHLATSNPEADRRRRRRALTHEEAARLVRAAESGPDVMGMSGPDRAMAYAVALGTGFRSDELRSLTPERFDLAAQPATAVVPGAYTKNGKEAVQPIPPALADRLRHWLPSRPAGQPVFPLPDRTAEMLRADLEAAGIAYQTPAGVVDFHALRAAYISHLVSSGTSVKTCQTLARHSTPSLTIGIYAKASPEDIGQAMGSLPSVLSSETSPGENAGTDVQDKAPTHKEPLAPPVPHSSGGKGRDLPPEVASDSQGLSAIRADSTSPNSLTAGELVAECRSMPHAVADCRRPDLNRDEGYPSEDFKSSASAFPPRRPSRWASRPAWGDVPRPAQDLAFNLPQGREFVLVEPTLDLKRWPLNSPTPSSSLTRADSLVNDSTRLMAVLNGAFEDSFGEPERRCAFPSES